MPAPTLLNVATMSQDLRLRATIGIWALLTPALLACLPLMALADQAWRLPLGLFAAATITTVGIWLLGQRPQRPDPDIQALQQRLEVLETIISHPDDPLHLID